MKAGLQLFFVLFYIASTYVVGQIRTGSIVQQLQSATRKTEERTIERLRSKDYDHLPRFREAQAANDAQYQPLCNSNPILTEDEILRETRWARGLELKRGPSYSRPPPDLF